MSGVPAHRGAGAGPADVTIRQAEPGDARALASAVRRSRELHRHWATSPTTARTWEDQLATRSARRMVLLAFLPDGAVVGMTTLSEIVRGAFQNAYLGYEAYVPHEGRGYMTRAVRLTVDLAFDTLGLHRLEANVQPDNARSLALVRRLGFRWEGFSPRYLWLAGAWRDHERFALTREEWRGDPDDQNSRSSPESMPRSAS